MVKHIARWPSQYGMGHQAGWQDAEIEGGARLFMYATDDFRRGYDDGFRKASLLGRLATDQRTMAERKWREHRLAPKPQAPCDHGLFSDDRDQLDFLTGSK